MTFKPVGADTATGQMPDVVEQRMKAQAVAGSAFVEAVQDVVGAMVAGSGAITVAYDDAAGKLTLTVTAGTGGTGYTDENARDAIGAALKAAAGSGVSVAVDDAGDTITIGISGLTISQVTGLQAALDALNSSIARTRGTAITKVGLYTYASDYDGQRENIATLGTTIVRVSNASMTAAYYRELLVDGLEIMVTLSGTARANFGNDTDWINDYLAKVDAFLTAYPCRWLEVWNEPNYNNITAAQYGALLVATYAHVKASFPTVGVVGFAAGGEDASASGWVRDVLNAVPASATAFDVVSIHPYNKNAAPEKQYTHFFGPWGMYQSITDTFAQLASHQVVGKPLWITEVGWQISQADGGTYNVPAADSDGRPLLVTPTQLAAYRVRLFLMCLKYGVARLFHMYVIDTDGYNAGFFKNNVARPQAVATAVMNRLLPNPAAITPISDGTNDVYLYRVDTDRGPVVVGWSDSGAGTMPVHAGSTVYDVNGTVIAPGATLTTSPMYAVPNNAYSAARLRVPNAAAGTQLGSVTKKIEVFDATGTSLGFIPVYSAIT